MSFREILLKAALKFLEWISDAVDNHIYIRLRKSDPIAAQHYIGGLNFKDSLYNSTPQLRERSAIWKLVRPPLNRFLYGHTWRWLAVNIPLKLLNPLHPDGDIDMLVHARTAPREDAESIYRAFEVKTSLISNNGKARALKRAKFRKYRGQLNKLREFGAQQTIILESYIAQAGYSIKNQNVPKDIVDISKAKFKEVVGSDHGYMIMFIESMFGFDEHGAGITHQPIYLHAPKTYNPTGNFKELIDELDRFQKSETTGGGYLIAYCRDCNRLTRPKPSFYTDSQPYCLWCGHDLREE